jgi:flagellin-specific chaperone FliS
MTDSVRAYRASTGDSSTHLGLLLSVYDALAEDLRLAADAVANGDIVGRCRHSQHALQLLGHLESWLSLFDDAALQDSLSCFYAYLRGEIICLQSAAHRGGFVELAMHVCETRAVWQKKQSDIRSHVQQPALEVVSWETAAQTGNLRCWSA